MLTPQGFYKRPLLTIDAATGNILSLEEYNEGMLDRMAGVEFFPGLICRGLVNAHCHVELSYLLNAIEPEGGYANFAAGMAAKRDKFTAEQRIEAMQRADRSMWEEGIDAVGDIVNDSTSFPVKECSPIEYRSFAEVFGLRQSNIEACRTLLHNPNTTLTPHSTYSIQEGDLRSVCNESNGTNMAPLSIHFMESADELLLYIGKGRLHDWYSAVGFTCDFLHYDSPAHRIASCVPKDRPLMLVHNCYVTQQDIDIIMEHRTAPTYWVLCPRSNKYISGIEPKSVELLRKNRLRICVGTDSLASNTSLSIIEELKAFHGVPLDELLQWATTNGAEALGVKRQGWIHISGIDHEKLSLTPQSKAHRIL